MTDERLLQYVLEQERKGYSKDQIHEALLASGYSPEQVRVAFSELSGGAHDDVVHDYVEQYARDGLSATQTFAKLREQEYAPAKIRRAINAVYGPGAAPGGHHVIAFAIIALLIAGGGLFFLLNEPQIPAANPGTGQVSLSPPEIIMEVLDLARDNPDSAVQACKQRLLGRDRDVCLLDIAVLPAVEDLAYCGHIADIALKDTCLLNFADAHLEQVCAQVQLAKSKELCSRIKSLKG